jgi:hypothetical protein
LCLAACAGEGDRASEPITQVQSALSAATVLGLEDPSGWSATAGTKQSTDVRVQGSAGLAVSGFTYTELTSNPLSTLSGVTASLAFDLMIPPEQPNPDWYGFTQLYVSIPSQGVTNLFLGQKDLKPLPIGVYKRLIFDVPAATVTKMKAAYSDLTFKIVLNVPTGATGTYRLDTVRFVGEKDIDVQWISRTPAINYDASPNVPGQGSAVTWVGHLKNRGTKDVGSFQYKWLVNNQQVATGTVSSLAAGASTTVSYPTTWTNTVTNITLTADSGNAIAEGSEANNSRTIRNNALMVGLWIEQKEHDFFDEHQFDFQAAYSINDGANSWEDWAQRQMNRWNLLFQNAVYASAPQGGLDRVRLEKVTVVPDGALPLTGGGIQPTNYPDVTDHTVDMMWGFPSSQINQMDFYNPTDPGSPFNYEPSFVHEASHARFLIDSYMLTIGNSVVYVLDDTGNRIFPNDGGIARVTSTGSSMMNTNGSFYAEWEIDWLNAYGRLRALPGWGNTNANFGQTAYMQLAPLHIPAQNKLRILGANGQPLANARVRVYKNVVTDGVYSIDNVAEIDVMTGADGLVTLGSQPFSISNASIDGGTFPNCVNFVRVTKNGLAANGWVDLAQVHVAYFRGQTQTATYDVPTSL